MLHYVLWMTQQIDEELYCSLSVLFCVVPPPTGLLRVQAAGLGVERTEDDEGEDFP